MGYMSSKQQRQSTGMNKNEVKIETTNTLSEWYESVNHRACSTQLHEQLTDFQNSKSKRDY